MRDLWDNQTGNMFLWAPFLMAFGAAAYFTMPNEPGLICPGAIACIAIAAVFVRRAAIPIKAAALFAFGFFYAAAFTQFIATPQMPRNMRDAQITGIVSKIDYTDTKSRIYIRTASSEINAVNGRPTATVRVSAGSDITLPNIGDTIRADVGLFRPNLPDAPGTFDYARWAYFNNLSATGYITGYDTISHADAGGINNLRDYLHKQAKSFLADSLVLGYKNAVPKDDGPLWTATGVGHVWSISGFHMTLVAGWLFAVFYSIFRMIAPITRRIPARVPAICCAWFGLLFYLFLSGVDVATVRAFLMTTLVFAAFIFGRNAISMRNICIAMCIIFLMNPHYVMQAGFQLSFAAIFGLIWFWNGVRPRMPHNKILKIIYTATLTSIVATVFTTPFVIAHFYSLPLYGLLGNLVLLPVFSFAIMPLVIIGTITAVFGWNWPLGMAGNTYEFTLKLAHIIADLPGATIIMPHMTNTALCLIIIGFLALMFIRPIRVRINYILFAVFIATGAAVVILTPRAAFYATHDHELVGFVENGKLEFNKSRASNHYFAFNTWKQLNGEKTDTPNKRRKHNKGLYVFHTRNFTLAYVQKFVPLKTNIARLCHDDDIDYIVSYFNVNSENCNAKILRGGFVIYESGHVQHTNANRRWHNPRI